MSGLLRRIVWIVFVAIVVFAVAILIIWQSRPRPGHVNDEALRAGRDASTFAAADEDYFHDMDGVPALSANEVKGRNTWIVWSGGNDRFWDVMAKRSFGALDFLKTISSHPNFTYSRDNRWEYFGLSNEPCFEKPTGPDPARHGLWLDKRSLNCPVDPFENENKYPGVKLGARGKNMPVGSSYGYGTGIVGLRLFPNPDFNEKAAREWDPVRYYNDPTYYNSRDLVRPYRVGMSCGFCHVGPSPIKPPADPDHPKWENLTSNVGAQYFWIDRIFYWDIGSKTPAPNRAARDHNFVYQLFHTSRPGTLDTSLISTDNINNPRTMNAFYLLGPRLQESKRWGEETLSGGERNNKQFNDYFSSGPLTEFYRKPGTVWVPRVLKDGSDSVGALGALNRVYLNIGTFSEEWLLHFNALVGGKPVTPIPIATSRNNSAYFKATEAQTPAMAAFFLKTTGPHHLKDAPGGDAYLTTDKAKLTRGKVVFAETCARCHSSKLPPSAPGIDPNGCNGQNYMSCWNSYWAWTKTAAFKDKMREIVLADDFLDNNYLSAEFRVPVTLLHTNACSPLATNAIAGNIWDNFSSTSYKNLPSVGQITWYHPATGEPHTYQMPAGGRGFTRPPSLVSVWSTAPFLLNNSVGRFEASPSVEKRMLSFQNSIEQMLWPEKREHDAELGTRIPGAIDRTTTSSYLRVANGYLPDSLQILLKPYERFFPWIFSEGGVEIGPIPAGTPVDLLANLNPLSEDPDPIKRAQHVRDVAALLLRLKLDLLKLPKDATKEQARQVLMNLVDPLLAVSKCPDFVVNRGHYFGTGYIDPGAPDPVQEAALSDSDKRALIEFLKTF